MQHQYNSSCNIQYPVEAPRGKSLKIVSISCQDSHNKSLSLAGPVPNSSDLEKGIFTVNGFKEYLVEQDLLIKQSPVLAEIVSSSQGKSNKVVLKDVKCAIFEAKAMLFFSGRLKLW